MIINELRAKAQKCRQRASSLTGDKYHREMQRAQALEAEANEREAWLARPPKTQQSRGVSA